MIGEQKNERPQGFVIIVENCREKSWPRIYVSKARGEKKIKTCGPDFLEIFCAVQELLLECRRVALLTQAYPAKNNREKIIRDIKGYYPEVEIVRMAGA